MATRLRLARTGTKKQPHYRIVVADSRSPRDGRFIEQVGAYHPLLHKEDESRIKLDEERVRYWLDRGTTPSDRVSRFLEKLGLVKAKTRNNPIKAKPGKKAQERAAAEAAATGETAEPASSASQSQENAAEQDSQKAAVSSAAPAAAANADEGTAGSGTAAPASAEGASGGAVDSQDGSNDSAGGTANAASDASTGPPEAVAAGGSGEEGEEDKPAAQAG